MTRPKDIAGAAASLGHVSIAFNGGATHTFFVGDSETAQAVAELIRAGVIARHEEAVRLARMRFPPRPVETAKERAAREEWNRTAIAQGEEPSPLVVTRNGVPLEDQKEGVRLFREAAIRPERAYSATPEGETMRGMVERDLPSLRRPHETDREYLERVARNTGMTAADKARAATTELDEALRLAYERRTAKKAPLWERALDWIAARITLPEKLF